MLIKQIHRIGWIIRYLLARVIARKISRVRLKRIRPKKLLVICYGNIYRSPFVAKYLSDQLRSDPTYKIKSAGFIQKKERKSMPEYVEMAKNYGVDLSEHLSTIVNQSLFDWADAIIIMDGKNYKLSLLLDISVSNKLIWLGALSDEISIEILDPYSRSHEEQQQIISQMLRSSDALIQNLKSENSLSK
ncbi:MAG: low molecular weight phosphatase family protein [Gammaproteobacteria bacterium]|nr:low molecular weight phosphatase family protein [Gammaproteobacteria bacterium]